MLKPNQTKRITENGWSVISTTGNSPISNVTVMCVEGHQSTKQLETLMNGGVCLECRKVDRGHAVYVAKFNDTTVKIGISKIDRVKQRLYELRNDLELLRYYPLPTKRIALDIEHILLTSFHPVECGSGDGKTEYRKATLAQVEEVMNNVPTKSAIKALKEKHNLSASELARLVYVTDGSAHKWLTGERQIDQARWELLLYKLEGVEPQKPVWVSENQKSLLGDD